MALIMTLRSVRDLVRLAINFHEHGLIGYPHIYILEKDKKWIYLIAFQVSSERSTIIYFQTIMEREPEFRYIVYNPEKKEQFSYKNDLSLRDFEFFIISVYKIVSEKGLIGLKNDITSNDIHLQLLKIEDFRHLVRIATDFYSPLFIFTERDNYWYFMGFPLPPFTIYVKGEILGYILYSRGPKPSTPDGLARFIRYRDTMPNYSFSLGRKKWGRYAPLIYLSEKPSWLFIKNI